MVFVLVVSSRHSVALIVWIRFFFHCRKFSVLSLTFSSLNLFGLQQAGVFSLGLILVLFLLSYFVIFLALCLGDSRSPPPPVIFWLIFGGGGNYEFSFFFFLFSYNSLFVCLFYVIILSLVSEYVKKIFKRYLVFLKLPSFLHWSVFFFFFFFQSFLCSPYVPGDFWFSIHVSERKTGILDWVYFLLPCFWTVSPIYLFFCLFVFFWVVLAITLSGQESRESIGKHCCKVRGRRASF